MTTFARLGACWLTATAGVLAQQVWKVDCMGAPGSHFTDLPQAVAAAAPGDTILVYVTVPTGTCNTYTAPTIDKPLSIVGFGAGQNLPGSNIPSQARLQGHLNITGIAAGQQVKISNFLISHTSIGGGGECSIIATDCAGSILLEDIDYFGGGAINQVIRFQRCDHVVLRGCSFQVGGVPVLFIDSKALITTTSIIVSPPATPLVTPYTDNSEPLALLRSSVTLAGSFVQGPPAWSGTGMLHKSGALLVESTLRIGASSVLRGGWVAGWGGGFSAAYVVWGTAPCVIEKDPRAPVYPYLPPPTVTPVDETFHDWVVANEWFRVKTYGPPGGTAMLFVGEMMFPTPLPPYGILGVDPASAILLTTASLSSTLGDREWVCFCPPQIPVGFAFAFQAATISPTGQIGLTVPSPLTVGWNKSVVP